jgi:hypothetical protein
MKAAIVRDPLLHEPHVRERVGPACPVVSLNSR